MCMILELEIKMWELVAYTCHLELAEGRVASEVRRKPGACRFIEASVSRKKGWPAELKSG